MSKGQTQIIVFVLLLLISLVLVFAAVNWGTDIGKENIDVGRVTNAEHWIDSLDAAIQSTVRSGGSIQLEYHVPSQIGLSDVGLNDTVEISMPVTIDLPTQWINLTAAGEQGLIRERKEGDQLKLQLSYPLRPGFAIDLFTDGPQITTPTAVLVERNTTYIQTIDSANYTVVRVRLRFI